MPETQTHHEAFARLPEGARDALLPWINEGSSYYLLQLDEFSWAIVERRPNRQYPDRIEWSMLYVFALLGGMRGQQWVVSCDTPRAGPPEAIFTALVTRTWRA